MKIRRYLGSNAQEAILKVKMDLGNDALILSTRKVRQKGIFKIFAKPLVEVLAAVDDNYAAKKEQELSKQDEKNPVSAKEAAEKKILDEKEEKIANLENKVSDMENMLRKMYEQMLSGKENAHGIKSDESQNSMPKVLQLFYNNLLRNEVEAEIAKRIIDLVNKKTGGNSNVNNTASVLYNIIVEILGKPETIKLREDGKPTVVIFIGPTGVGKTTTLAKIAANYSLNYKKSVGLITADTYRIAAVEQLKTYAEILGIPITVIYSPSEMGEAISNLSDRDIILIDTAGRSFSNKSQFDELKAVVGAAQADEIYLVLSATTSTRNSREILKHYSFIKHYKLIFTKMDETPVAGLILNIKYMTGKNLSYITTGQNVPDDIEVANVDKLAKNLMGSIS